MVYLVSVAERRPSGRSIDVSGAIVLQPRDHVDLDLGASDDGPRPTDAFAKR